MQELLRNNDRFCELEKSISNMYAFLLRQEPQLDNKTPDLDCKIINRNF